MVGQHRPGPRRSFPCRALAAVPDRGQIVKGLLPTLPGLLPGRDFYLRLRRLPDRERPFRHARARRARSACRASSQPPTPAQRELPVSSPLRMVWQCTVCAGRRGRRRPVAGRQQAPSWALAVQPDGKILLGGGASPPCAGQPRQGSSRGSTPDGSLDSCLQRPERERASVYALAIQPDGKILIGGSFTTVAGQTRKRVARLNPDGSLDPTFDDPDADATRACAGDPGGRQDRGRRCIRLPWAGRSGWQLPGCIPTARWTLPSLARATHPPCGEPNTLALQPDGKILMGGRFDDIGRAVGRQADPAACPMARSTLPSSRA